MAFRNRLVSSESETVFALCFRPPCPPSLVPNTPPFLEGVSSKPRSFFQEIPAPPEEPRRVSSPVESSSPEASPSWNKSPVPVPVPSPEASPRSPSPIAWNKSSMLTVLTPERTCVVSTSSSSKRVPCFLVDFFEPRFCFEKALPRLADAVFPRPSVWDACVSSASSVSVSSVSAASFSSLFFAFAALAFAFLAFAFSFFAAFSFFNFFAASRVRPSSAASSSSRRKSSSNEFVKSSRNVSEPTLRTPPSCADGGFV
mmetsp:Transcript_6363/g.24003  ORF Transcript_6363/g.24003 Transcript_6363/m.24003 type:complete len:257 (-) Transcript_6363:757-1527(-)